mmetsp:Transcript_22380/g.70206  ORF Transcript_22380/g.70206 Transcript_22380/m.70206 type:complete len:201 (+) Transcript_22380:848-1450(+)
MAVDEVHEVVDVPVLLPLLHLLLPVDGRVGVHQPDDPLLRGRARPVQRGAVDVVHVAEQPQRLDAHPPAVLHQPLSAPRVLDDVRGDPLDALAHIDADVLLLARLLVRSHGAHADPQRLLRGHLVLPGPELELDVLVRAGDEPPLRGGLEAQVVCDRALGVGVPGDLLLADDPQGEEGALVLLPTLVAEREPYDVVPGLH